MWLKKKAQKCLGKEILFSSLVYTYVPMHLGELTVILYLDFLKGLLSYIYFYKSAEVGIAEVDKEVFTDVLWCPVQRTVMLK